MKTIIILMILFTAPLFAQIKEPIEVKPIDKVILIAKVVDYSDKAYDNVKKIGSYDATKKEVTFSANKSSNKLTWRLVYNDSTGIMFESNGYTYTILNLFEGTKEECLAEATKKNIVIDTLESD